MTCGEQRYMEAVPAKLRHIEEQLALQTDAINRLAEAQELIAATIFSAHGPEQMDHIMQLKKSLFPHVKEQEA